MQILKQIGSIFCARTSESYGPFGYGVPASAGGARKPLGLPKIFRALDKIEIRPAKAGTPYLPKVFNLAPTVPLAQCFGWRTALFSLAVLVVSLTACKKDAGEAAIETDAN